MPHISNEKINKIIEQVIQFLYTKFPNPLFTSEIAKEVARDEEFMKDLLLLLEKKGLVVKITKNPEGYEYKIRLRWRLSNKAQETYSGLQ